MNLRESDSEKKKSEQHACDLNSNQWHAIFKESDNIWFCHLNSWIPSQMKDVGVFVYRRDFCVHYLQECLGPQPGPDF